MSASTLSHHLAEQKRRFLAEASNGNGWTIVVGNEAGDLDTLASSIGYAWFRSQAPATETEGKAIALIPTLREDFVLRPENIHALQLAKISDSFEELLCPEDLPDVQFTDFALVDHNSLHPNFSKPGVQVTAVIDHHEDEGKYLDTASPRVIEPSGSCASLVTRIIMSRPLQIPPELATLLLSAVLIDTQGLRGKALEIDREASAWLLPRSNLVSQGAPTYTSLTAPVDGDPSISTALIKSLSSNLNAKKFAVSNLGTRDLLRRDYKEYSLSISISSNEDRLMKAGLSTVPMRLSSLFSLDPPSTVSATQAWMKERGLSVLGVLTTYRNKRDKGRREEMWVVDESLGSDSDLHLSRCLFDGLEANEDLRLKRVGFKRCGFQQSPFDPLYVARVYKQKNASCTRKQVAPIMKRILEG
ncbi:hypothetical protein HYDPIDRAFT_89879 [Hydnomerulius pinastri MD-312]|uniref:DHHA2 domain-containing protein n=1 Tax=Hydnomerulius pinastri MD-312 TaxID=994086 RepID=A0A0C9WA52_9AGAM|nr:hypothetical protein HYDPIDRAFT_89879 [Hydnomerulius pinastri MD-312]